MTTIKWLIGLAAIAALAWFASGMDDTGTRRSILDSPSKQELPPVEMPAIGLNRLLSVAEIRWCLSQDIGLRTIETRLGTGRAIDRYNELADNYNSRCNGHQYSRTDREEATRFVDGARRLIAAAALEEIQRLNDERLTRQIQELLEMLGYEPGEVDGVYGLQTKAAIEAFQREGRHDVDGLLGRELLDRLRLTHTRRLLGRENARTANVVVRVFEGSQGEASDISAAQAVPDAEVKISGDRGFHGDQLTNERGRAEFSAVPVGKLDIDVLRNGDRSRVTFQVTEDPDQEIWIALPTRKDAASAQVRRR